MIKLLPIKDDCEKVYIFINDINIGKLNYYVTNDIIMINYITVYEEYRKFGFGRDIVNYLINSNKGKIIHGDALPEAIEFWKKMGAEFSDPFPSKIKPEVLLTPFIIKNY
jgi:GNAT superfamily N-acetyltransferase